jgi:hypothetical protein
MDSLEVLSEYEAGRAVTMIEWVARSGKPIAELTSRRMLDAAPLARDVDRCITLAHERVRGFLIETEPTVWIAGFYVQPWAIEAFAFLLRNDPLDAYHRRWVSGLLFGYGAEPVQRFINDACDERDATLQPNCKVGMVEMFHHVTMQSHSRNIRPARCPMPGTTDLYVRS